MTVLLPDCKNRFEYEHHFIEHEPDGGQKDVGED
jgi:hypothetical protein